ncbi:hypothetical protein CDD82_4009 [Ophiocordyceps australis]|uniref:Uncharacterized protein n=1 Tax=Ophiocordyceps australis TaxID=1399860 RepID=A0A2C5ZB61_9HYPO|nr:hypothetical protein CDD82_4009 [Ophiocordyceps australis]
MSGRATDATADDDAPSTTAVAATFASQVANMVQQGDRGRWSRLKGMAQRSKSTPRAVQMPDWAVCRTTIGGHGHIAISIPDEARNEQQHDPGGGEVEAEAPRPKRCDDNDDDEDDDDEDEDDDDDDNGNGNGVEEPAPGGGAGEEATGRGGDAEGQGRGGSQSRGGSQKRGRGGS